MKESCYHDTKMEAYCQEVRWLEDRFDGLERVGCFVEVPWDVIEFEAVEFILQSSDFLAVCSHLGIVIA